MRTYLEEEKKLDLAKKLLGGLALIISTVTVCNILIKNSTKIEGENFQPGKFISYKSSDVALLGKEYFFVQVENTVEEIPIKTVEERFTALNLRAGEFVCLRSSNFSDPKIVKNEQCKK
jgi:hypothetical protein